MIDASMRIAMLLDSESDQFQIVMVFGILPIVFFSYRKFGTQVGGGQLILISRKLPYSTQGNGNVMFPGKHSDE